MSCWQLVSGLQCRPEVKVVARRVLRESRPGFVHRCGAVGAPPRLQRLDGVWTCSEMCLMCLACVYESPYVGIQAGHYRPRCSLCTY